MIHAYLADRQLPSLAFLEAAASILGVRESWLAYEDGEMSEAAERVAAVERGGEENQLVKVLDAMPKLYTRSPMVRAAYLEAIRRVIEARPDRDELTDEKIVGLASNLWAGGQQDDHVRGAHDSPPSRVERRSRHVRRDRVSGHR